MIIPIVELVALIIPVVYPITIVTFIVMVTLTIQLNTISTVTTVTLLIVNYGISFTLVKELTLKQFQQYLINLLLRFVVVYRIHEFPWISIIGEGMVFHHSQLMELTLKRFQTFPIIL